MLLKNLRPADEYHRFARSALAPWDLVFLSRIRELAQTLAPGLCVDVGTGTGVVPIKLGQDRKMAAWHFIGIDLDPAMVAEGRPLITSLGLSGRISLEVADAMALPFAPSSVDMVVSRATLHHLPDKALSLREILRALRPGGVGLVHDMRRDIDPGILERFQHRRREAGYPPTHIEEKLTLQQVHQLVAEAAVAAEATVSSGERGLAAIGYEILLRKAA
jgi:ubiquinone/menaquinone biosynthesis C-methylase UbiE